jgi:hypothetical protein
MPAADQDKRYGVRDRRSIGLPVPRARRSAATNGIAACHHRPNPQASAATAAGLG